MPGHFGSRDLSNKVETDVPVSKRRAVVTQRLIPIADEGGRAVASAMPNLMGNRELFEEAFDKGMLVFERVFVKNCTSLTPRFYHSFFQKHSADPARITIGATGIIWWRFVKTSVKKRNRVCWIPFWEVNVLIFLFEFLFCNEISL